MNDTHNRTRAQEAAEDVFFGQAVMIWARWAIIAAAAVQVLWTAKGIGELTGKALLVIALMAINFFLHGRFLMERPVNRFVIVVASAIDVALITAMVLFLSGGFKSQFFVFYYPVLVGFALVFPVRLTAVFTAAVLGIYALAAVAGDPGFVADAQAHKVMLFRLITMAAMGGLGTWFWRVERERRRRPAGSAASAR